VNSWEHLNWTAITKKKDESDLDLPLGYKRFVLSPYVRILPPIHYAQPYSRMTELRTLRTILVAPAQQTFASQVLSCLCAERCICFSHYREL